MAEVWYPYGWNSPDKLRFYVPGCAFSTSWFRMKTIHSMCRPECFYDLLHLRMLIRKDVFTFEQYSQIVTTRLKNQAAAFRLCPPTRFHTRATKGELLQRDGPWLDEYMDDVYTNFLRLSGKTDLTQTSRLRAAFQKLEFRCLRKAYAPGAAGHKRSRKEFEKEFAKEEEKEEDAQ